MLPYLPLVEKSADFWAFVEAGRKLAALHFNYEDEPPPKGVLVNGKPLPREPFSTNMLAVNKMAFPAKAYEYVVNGKSAVEWIMERYALTAHKESGIKNNSNDWAAEHNNPQYILDLLLSEIAVGIKTVDITAALPKVGWE